MFRITPLDGDRPVWVDPAWVSAVAGPTSTIVVQGPGKSTTLWKVEVFMRNDVKHQVFFQGKDECEKIVADLRSI